MALHVPKAPGFQSMMKDGSRFFSGLEEAVIRNIGKTLITYSSGTHVLHCLLFALSIPNDNVQVLFKSFKERSSLEYLDFNEMISTFLQMRVKTSPVQFLPHLVPMA